MRFLGVYCNNELAGLLKEIPGEGYVFEYDQKYLANPSSPSVSLTLPKSGIRFSSRALFPFFCNMISEGHNREVQSRILRIDREDDFGILAATAQFDTPGAITVKPIEND